MENSKENAMRAAIIGFAVGDALGVPVEFLDRSLLQKHKLKEMIGYGSHKVPDGTWSDDTSLMLATMDSIVDQNGINFADIMHKFTEWVDCAKYTATNKLFDIGISTNKAIVKFKNGEVATKCGGSQINENGNGSLMRILPFVFYLRNSKYSDDEKIQIINNASALTHAHEISMIGCNIYADYINFLLDGVDKFEALELLRNIDYRKYYSDNAVSVYRRILNGKLSTLKSDEIKSSGYVVDTLEASLWCTLNSDSYENAVVEAVNLGDDTDTIGAITGSINGLIYGFESIPKRWLNRLRNSDYLYELTNQFLNFIPSKRNGMQM